MDMDRFATSFLNEMKRLTKGWSEDVLNGQMDHDQYKYCTGVIRGFDMACESFIEMAKNETRKQFGDDEDE